MATIHPIRPAPWEHGAVEELRTTIRRLARKMLGRDEDRLAFLTISIAAYEIDLRDDRQPIIDQAKHDLANFKVWLAAVLKGSGSIDSRLSRKGTIWIGASEIDLIDATDFQGQSKRDMLKALGIKDDSGLYDQGAPDPNKAIALLHAHIIINRRGHTDDDLSRALRIAFPGNRRVLIQSLHTDKSTDANLSNLVSYMTKFRWNHTTQAEDSESGKTAMRRQFAPSWREWLKHIYIGIGLDDFPISNL